MIDNLVILGKNKLECGFPTEESLGDFTFSDMQKIFKVLKETTSTDFLYLCDLISTFPDPYRHRGTYIPSVIRYSQELLPLFDAKSILFDSIFGKQTLRPTVDFITFSRGYLACLLQTNSDPAILFKSSVSAKICVGTLATPAIYNHEIFARLMDKVKYALAGGRIDAELIMSRKYFTKTSLFLPTYLQNRFSVYDIYLNTDKTIIVDDYPDKYFTEKDKAQNLIIVY